MKSLIVNADDFGMSPAVNSGIIRAHQRGIVTSATMLANGPAFAPAADLARRHPTLGIGVHLNLVEGRPIAGAGAVPSLLGDDGAFLGSPLRLAVRMGSVRRSELVAELSAQIARVVDAGIEPTHVDSHMHAHCLPAVRDAVIAAAEQFGIRRIRWPRERNLPGIRRRKRSRFTSAIVALLCRAGSAALASLLRPHHFIGPQLMGALDAPTLAAVIARLSPGITELMCHPSYAAGPAAHIRRQAELAALTSPLVREAIFAHQVRLVSYDAVALH